MPLPHTFHYCPNFVEEEIRGNLYHSESFTHRDIAHSYSNMRGRRFDSLPFAEKWSWYTACSLTEFMTGVLETGLNSLTLKHLPSGSSHDQKPPITLSCSLQTSYTGNFFSICQQHNLNVDYEDWVCNEAFPDIALCLFGKSPWKPQGCWPMLPCPALLACQASVLSLCDLSILENWIALGALPEQCHRSLILLALFPDCCGSWGVGDGMISPQMNAQQRCLRKCSLFIKTESSHWC